MQDDTRSALEDKIARLTAELQAERVSAAVADRVSRLEEQLKWNEKALKDGLDNAKSLSIRAYATMSLVFTLLGVAGWTTINTAIKSKVEEEFKKGGFEERIKQETANAENKIRVLSRDIEKLSIEAKTIVDNFRATTGEQLKLVQEYTAEQLRKNPNLATSVGAKQAGLKLTPIFGITPGVTTRGQIDELARAGKLEQFGRTVKRDGNSVEFEFGTVVFQKEESDFARNPYDTVVSMEYWGSGKLALGLDTSMELEQAKQIAAKNFVWLGTQNFRGLVFSNQKNGPILLEISWILGRSNPLTYKIYGPI